MQINPSLATELSSTCWAMSPETIRPTMNQIQLNPLQIKEILHQKHLAAEARIATQSAAMPAGSIAVINVTGTITSEDAWWGETSTRDLTAQLKACMSNQSVSGILLNINSPGGSVYGTPEFASLVSAAKSKKLIWSVANACAASAAYWIGCATSKFCCVPSGEVGSIGVWTQHSDYSAYLANLGIKTTIVQAGKYKTEGNPYNPLDETSESYMQSRINDYYSMFTSFVAKQRGVTSSIVKSGMGQGRMLGARAAVEENMIDAVDDLDGILSSMQRVVKGSVISTAKAQVITTVSAGIKDARLKTLQLM